MTARTLRTIVILLVSFFLITGPAPAVDKQKQTGLNWLDENRAKLEGMSRAIWDFAEIGMLEYRSSEYLAGVLEESGFAVKRGVAGMPTAFVASYGSGKPVIGINAEYDALPGLSQKVSTRKEPVEQGAPGHGCGHNLFGSASVMAALAVKEVMDKHKLDGTVRLFGCPAEETLVGKIFMVRDGVYDGTDAVLSWHPSDSTKVSLGRSLAMNSFTVTFFGKTAHGAGDPWEGRSALDAVELMNHGVNMMREHVKPTARIHYVISDGGNAPNVVPDRAQVWYFVRDVGRAGVDAMYEWLGTLASSAAAAIQTTHEIELITGCYPLLNNQAGSEIMQKNLEIAGPPGFSEKEVEFAKAIQTEFGKEPAGIHMGLAELKVPTRQTGFGSTDEADVSWIMPLLRLQTACKPVDVPGHSWGTVACGNMGIGYKGAAVAAKTLALTAVDLLDKPKLLQKVKQEWREKTEGFTYNCAVPANQPPPVRPNPYE
jgi:aminobenzoyl-glutamate utilization protein B